MRVWATAVLLAIGGCFSDNGGGATNPATGTTGVASTTEPATTSTGVAPTDTGESTADTTVSTTEAPTSEAPTSETSTTGSSPEGLPCDAFAMDCPDGFKCAPYATDGGVAWDANKCVPVAGNDTPGEGCTVEGSGTSGYDSCVAGALCTNVDMNNTGICVALCRGTMESPACSPGLACLSTNGAVLNLCVQACDPLAQNCMLDGQACIPDDGEFLCVDDASGGVQMDGTPCLYINECGPGLFCGVKELAPVVCADVGDADCCLSFCDLSDDACPGTTVCAAYFEPPSPDYPQVGYCADPD